jgi:hypothetical protein
MRSAGTAREKCLEVAKADADATRAKPKNLKFSTLPTALKGGNAYPRSSSRFGE